MISFAELITLSTEPLHFVLSPEKRIFWGYILSAMLLAVVSLKMTHTPLWASCRTLVDYKVWLHPSSLNDIKWMFFNHLVGVIMVIPLLGGSLSIAIMINRFLIEQWGEGNFWAMPDIAVWSLFTVVIFLAEDFSRFLLHYFYHKNKWLWRFHAIHHSAEVLTPITLYRIHWVEMIINSLRSLLVIGSISALFMYCFDGAIRTVDIIGVSLFTFLFNIAGSNLRHSSIWLSFGRLEQWFISPAQHQIHHSSAYRHRDKNFGACLSIWDRWFRSFLSSRKEMVDHYGLEENRSMHHSFLKGFWGRQ